MGHKLHLNPNVNIEFFPTSFLKNKKTLRDAGGIIPFKKYILRSLFISGLDIEFFPTSF